MNLLKFVVITCSRTGSNLLMSLLDSHPHIWAANELFNRLEGRRTEAIWDRFFNKPVDIWSAGFKLFYYHPMDDPQRRVWDIIKGDKAIKIIHLRRINLLRTFVSREIAAKINEWKNEGNTSAQLDDKRIAVDIERCITMFEQTDEYERVTRNEFPDHPYIEVTYEALIENRSTVINSIFEFLGMPSAEVNTPLKRQNPEKLSDLLINYNEVVEVIRKTRFSYLVDGL